MSPTMTVMVLVVLWLIVVVPMVMRRKDARQRERSMTSFGDAMRALARVPMRFSRGVDIDTQADADASYVMPRSRKPAAEVFVAGQRRAASSLASARAAASRTATSRTDTARRAEGGPAIRRPVPVAEEALMYPVNAAEQMSAARQQMMARRRRSLTVLILGTVLTLVLAVALGGMAWLLTLVFAASLVGYLGFLRNQAIKDRQRRAVRQQRATQRRVQGYEATGQFAGERRGEGRRSEDDYATGEFDLAPRMVNIDDDYIELNSMDTVDLTGLYDQEELAEPQLQRRAG